MTAHGPEDELFDSADGLDALDFDTPHIRDDDSGLDALPDFVADEDGFHSSATSDEYGDVMLDAVGDNTEFQAADSEADDFDMLDTGATTGTDGEELAPVVHTINPPGTVSVTAYLNGSVAHVDLDPRATALTEAQLADEVRFVAAVAAAKATAIVHVNVVDMMVEQGVSLGEARNFVTTNMPFATPQQAADAELALIARHSDQEA